MLQISQYVEHLLKLCHVAEAYVPVASHFVMAIIGISAALAIGMATKRGVVPAILKITAHTTASWDDVIFNERVLNSAANIIPAVIIWMFLPSVFFSTPMVEELLERATAIYITVMMVSTVITFLGSLKNLEDSTQSTKYQYLHSFCGVAKIVVIFIAVIIVTSIIIDRSPMVLLAGLGATSAILMLVFQDTIKGLVAGIRLTSNNMLHRGDWITVTKAGIDGTVEEMTLTTVKVRNFDNTIVTITPQTLVDDSFQNWNGMQESNGRRVKRRLYFDFTTISRLDTETCQTLVSLGLCLEEDITKGMVNLTLFRRAMERYISQCSTVNNNMTFMVRQLEATPTGLPVEFYFFLKNKEWVAYEHDLAVIIEEIIAFAHLFKLKIYQYPTPPQI